tara:strand:- start:462 stop:893 length:432 start_codon:yes stop_codon:yes gene_type:complete
MLLKTSIDRKQKDIEIQQVCGQSFNLLTKFKNQIFGSPKYKIISIYPDDISFKKNNDLIYFNLELRQEGIVLYFRYKQDEYAIYGRFNQTLFQSSNNIFEIQIGNYIIKSEIQNNIAHHKFIGKFWELKNENLNSNCSYQTEK